MIDASSAVWVPAALAGDATGLEVMEHVLAADRVINVPVVKHHFAVAGDDRPEELDGGARPGRNRLHQSIHRAVAELGAMFRPTLTVVDATRVLMANGPTGGSLGDVRSIGAVAVGTNPVACDAWGAAQMGLDPAALPFVAEAEQRGLGRSDVAAVKELG